MSLKDVRQYKSQWEKPSLFYNKYVKWLFYGTIAAFLLWSLWSIRITPARFLLGLQEGADLANSAWPPNFTAENRLTIINKTIETLAMAVIATIVGIIASIPLALLASRNLVPLPVYYVGRFLVASARAFHALIIAIIAVLAVGFGPLAGIITLSIKTVGFFSKLLSEEIEDIDPTQLEAIQATGASQAQALIYAVVPQVAQRFVALTIYRWDINIRTSTIVGIVGAGGIGQVLINSFESFEYDYTLAIVIVIIGLVLAGEAISAVVRQRLETGSKRGLTDDSSDTARDVESWDRFTPKQRIMQTIYLLLAVALFLAAINHLEMSLRYVSTASEALLDLGSRMWPPKLSILPTLVDPLIISAHIAILGTLFSIVLSVPTALLAANNTTPHKLTYVLGRFIITATRSVNVIIWALIFVGMFGPGALAGAMALAVRSIGFIGKLLSEAIEEIDKTQVEAVTATGAGPLQIFTYAIVPQILPSFIGIATYRWDSNIRASTVVGFVGGGGIGITLQTAVNRFYWSEALVILVVILGVVLLSEGVAVYLRKKFI